MNETEKICLNCGKALKGRADKKFCDDYCRNNYNNRQNSDENNLVRNINNTLRKNRRLLVHILAETGEDMKAVTRQKMLEAGFNFKYFTHQYQNQKGQIYFFIYDYGYLPLENERLLIVHRK